MANNLENPNVEEWSDDEYSDDEIGTFYHHTDKDSANKIFESGVILRTKQTKTTTSDDARFGEGVYLTKISPFAQQREVAQNNFGPNAWKSKITKTQAAIVLQLPKALVQHCAAKDRDVYLYKGDLKLDDVKKAVALFRGTHGHQWLPYSPKHK